MKYSELNQLLLQRLPELFAGYAELKAIGDGDEPGPHVLYGDVLVPYLTALLKSRGSDVALARIFRLLEELALSGEQDIRDVLGASVLEGLNGERDARDAARDYMGPGTKRLAEEIERAWGS